MSTTGKHWEVLKARIEQNIARVAGRLAELQQQLEAVNRMISDPEKAGKVK